MAVNYNNPSVASSRGLLAKGNDYTNQLIGAKKYQDAKKAAKIKAEDEDLQKMLGDISIDYNKYHRIDREPAREMYAQWLNEAYKQYQTKDPAWRTKVSMTGQQLKFDLEQLRDVSANRNRLDEIGRSGKYVMDEDLKTLYDWQQTGDYRNPPKLSGSPYSSIMDYDPSTGTGNVTPVEKADVNKFVLTSIIGDPKEFYVDENMKNVGNRKIITTEFGVFDEDKVRARAQQAIGSPEFQNFIVTNKANLDQMSNQSPDVPPMDIAIRAWEDYVIGQIPKVSKQKVITEPRDININIGGEEENKYSTRFTSLSNLLGANINQSEADYSALAQQTGGKVEAGNKVILNMPEEAVGKPVVVQGDRLRALQNNGIRPTPQSGYTVGVPEQMQVRYGNIDPNGEFVSYGQEELNKMSPEKRNALQPILLVKYKAAETAEGAGDELSPDDFKKAPGTFFVAYNMSEGSPDLAELNNQYPQLYVNQYQKTMREMGNQPSKSAVAPKTTNEPAKTTPTKSGVTWK